MTKVTLHGALADAVGQAEWELAIQQPREAVAAIEANTGRLYRFLRESTGTEYRVIINGQDLAPGTPDAIPAEFYLVGDYVTIDIVPVPAGAGGIWQAIIGIVLIIVGAVMMYFGVPMAEYVIMAGIGMLVGGVAQMIAGDPKLPQTPQAPFSRTLRPPDAGQKEEDGNTPSYLFNGAQNTVQAGGPVPLCYGIMICGSQLVSMGISGASIDSGIIGSQKPSRPNDDFFDLAVWTRLKNDPRAALIPSAKKVRSYHAARVLELADTFDIQERWSAEAKKSLRNKVITVRQKRNLLMDISQVFNGPQRSISFAEAKNIYWALGLVEIDNMRRASWEAVMLLIALHYSPD